VRVPEPIRVGRKTRRVDWLAISYRLVAPVLSRRNLGPALEQPATKRQIGVALGSQSAGKNLRWERLKTCADVRYKQPSNRRAEFCALPR